MGIPRSLRPETVPVDTGTGFKYRQHQLNRQGGATRARSMRSPRGRSAWTGGRPEPSIAAAGAEARRGEGVRASLRAQEGFGSGHLDGGIDRGAGLRGAYEGEMSSEMERAVMGSVFGDSLAGAGLSALGTGALAGGLASGVPNVGTGEALGFGVQQGVKSGLSTLAGWQNLAATFGKGVVAAGNVANAQDFGQEVRQAALTDPIAWSEAELQNMQNIGEVNDFNASGVMSGLKGLWNEVKGAWTSGESAMQAQGFHDSQRASTMASLDPAYGGGRFGSEDEAKAQAMADLAANRDSGTGGLGGGGDPDSSGGWGGDPSGGFGV